MSEGPSVTGADIQFLLDTDAGFMVRRIEEIAEITEADCYYDEPGRMDGAKIYLLARGSLPKQVYIGYYLVEAGYDFHRKRVRLTDVDGGVVAEAPYRVYREANKTMVVKIKE